MARRFSAAQARAAAPLFAALGDPTRLSLVARLSAGGPQSIAQLSGSAEVSRQAVTRHLHVLADAGLARCARRGREQIWELRSGRLAQAHEHIDRIDAQWDAALQRLRELVDEG